MTEKSIRNAPAPAKLNLFLHVTGRREDGKHLLESVFILIDLHDSIDITVRDDSLVTRTGDIVGDPEKDLCVRAARLLQQVSGCTLGADINVVKRVPSGAGLGGGSSDAATVLMVLNKLWGLGYGKEKLMQIGVELGADVPFFIFGESAFARGIGEKLEPISVPDSCWALVMPERPTSTALIFSSPDLTRDTESATMALFAEKFEKEWPVLPGRNDLEKCAKRINPQIAQALEALGEGARMTGSGSAVFAWARDESEALRKTAVLPEGARGFAVRTLQSHPVDSLL